jgi:hypothetical protein
MPRVFDTLLAKGYKFVTVSELIAMDKGPAAKMPRMPATSQDTPQTAPQTSADAAAGASGPGSASAIPASTQ